MARVSTICTVSHVMFTVDASNTLGILHITTLSPMYEWTQYQSLYEQDCHCTQEYYQFNFTNTVSHFYLFTSFHFAMWRILSLISPHASCPVSLECSLRACVTFAHWAAHPLYGHTLHLPFTMVLSYFTFCFIQLRNVGVGKHRRITSDIYSMKDANILAIPGNFRPRRYQLQAMRHSRSTGFDAYNS